ncbi:MAG: STAS-like domain-containing protein [Phycisphaerales bacterium]|nr:STAS-like domain-containing protein [Phycisphaerales bacterium]
MLSIALKNHFLRSSIDGANLAATVLRALDDGETVCIEFSGVEIMTPSFANAFVMLLLERYEVPQLRERCEFLNRSDHVVCAMNRSVERYQQGIRLTTQRRPA